VEKIEAVDDKVMVDLRAIKKTEADIARVVNKIGRVEHGVEKLEAEIEIADEELKTLNRGHTNILNIVRGLQQQLNQLRQSA
jgi:hypothetical protein